MTAELSEALTRLVNTVNFILVLGVILFILNGIASVIKENKK